MVGPGVLAHGDQWKLFRVRYPCRGGGPFPTVVIEGEPLSCDGTALELEAVITGEEEFVWDDGSTEVLRTVVFPVKCGCR